MQNNVNNGKSHEKYWRLRQEPKPNGNINDVEYLYLSARNYASLDNLPDIIKVDFLCKTM